MNAVICVPGERVLYDLEERIIEEKTHAYQTALQELFSVPILFLQPYIADYRRKLLRQFQIVAATAKKIFENPKRKQILLRWNFPEYYERDPLYRTLLLYVPPLFTAPYIRQIINQLKRLIRRYYIRRINLMLVLFEKLATLQIENVHSDEELLRRLFTDKNLLFEYMYSHIEIEWKKNRIIEKGGDWKQFTTLDYFHSFSITTVPFYQYVAKVWKTINETLLPALKSKIADMYHIKTLAEGELEIVKSGKYRYKLVKEFPRSPQTMMEIFHDPDILVKHYPSPNIKIEKIAPDRLRYTISEKLPLMKIVLKYDLVCCFKGSIEEWWVENSKYIKEMRGFAVYEETPEGHCRYADILVTFSLDDQLKPFENVIIPALERMGRNNIEQLMENIYQFLVAQDNLTLPPRKDECQEVN
jgi:hypothetical protein